MVARARRRPGRTAQRVGCTGDAVGGAAAPVAAAARNCGMPFNRIAIEVM